MDLSLTELYEFRSSLKTALFTGAKKVKHNDRETEFQSVQQMQRALDQLNAEILRLEGRCPRTVINPTVTY